MKIAIVVFSALFLAVLSADDLDGIGPEVVESPRPFVPHIPYGKPAGGPYYYHRAPFAYNGGYYPAYYHHPYGQYPMNYLPDPASGYYPGSPSLFRGQQSQKKPDVSSPYPTEQDAEVSDDDALKQLLELKAIYDKNKDAESGVVLPSITAASRVFITLKTQAFLSFLSSLSFTTSTKTKTYVYPTLG